MPPMNGLRKLAASNVAGSIVVMGLLGCGQERGAGQNFTLEDSAGVVIATSSAGAWEPDERWSLSEQPFLTLGGSRAGEELWRVAGYVRAPDGSIAVLSAGHSQVRVFDSDGNFLRAIGREGSGPGELRFPGSIALALPDTVLVLDSDALEVFLLDGTWLESERVGPVPNPFGPGTAAHPTMVAPNRSILARVIRSRAGPPRGMQRADNGFAVLPRAGQPPVLLGWYPGPEQQRLEGNRGGNVLPPFFRSSTWSVGASAEAQFLAADNDRYQIDVFDSKGSLRRIIRRDIEPVVVKDEWVEAWKEVERGQPWTQRRPADFERVWAQMEVHETLPALERMFVDSESYLWVLRPTEVQLVYRTIDVFDPEGRFLGEVEPPSGFRPFPSPLIGEDFFMGVWVDEFDVESVRVYELQRHR